MTQQGKVKIPEAITKYIRKDAPKDAKLLAAKGSIPMSPIVQITVFTYLLGDEDKEIAESARNSLIGIPPSMLKNLLKENLHPKALDFFARNKADNPDLLEPLLLNKVTPDESFVFLADKVTGKALDIISGNQQRMLRTPDIANMLKKNPNIQRSEIEKIISFLRMSGIQVEGESPMLTQEEIRTIMEAATRKKEKPSQTPENLKATPSAEDEESEEEDFYETEDDELEDTGAFDDAGLDGMDDLFEEKDNYTEDEVKGIANKISKMSVPQKVKVALLGNKECRSVLIKDANKIVATSVIKSPKISDNEVHTIAQMRSVHDEIIRIIAANNDWVKNYTIKLALVNNPKTPLGLSVKFIQHLNIKDTADLSRNKNVSPQLQKLAKDRYTRMREGHG